MKISGLHKHFLLSAAAVTLYSGSANAQLAEWFNDLVSQEREVVQTQYDRSLYKQRKSLNKTPSAVVDFEIDSAPIENISVIEEKNPAAGAEFSDFLKKSEQQTAEIKKPTGKTAQKASEVKVIDAPKNLSMPVKPKFMSDIKKPGEVIKDKPQVLTRPQKSVRKKNVLKLPEGYLENKKPRKSDKPAFLRNQDQNRKQDTDKVPQFLKETISENINTPVLADKNQQQKLDKIKNQLKKTLQEEVIIEEAKKVELIDVEDTHNALQKSAGVQINEDTQLTLKSALQMGFKNNDALKSARQNIRIFDERLTQAYGNFRPDIKIKYGVGKNRLRSNSVSKTYDNEQKSISLTQPLFRGGGSLAQVRAAEDLLDAAVFEYKQREQEIFHELIKVYFDIIAAQSVLEFAVNNELRLKRNLQAAEIRFRAGDVTSTDVEQSRARAATGTAERITAENDLRNLHSQFERITGVEPMQLRFENKPVFMPKNINEALAIANSANPDLLRLERLAKALKSDYYQEIAQLLPQIDLVGSITETHGYSTSLNEIDNRSLMVQFSVPLYQSGTQYSSVREIKETGNQAKLDLRFKSKTIKQELYQAWNNFLNAVARVESNQISLEAAETAFKGVQSEEKLGARTVLDVLDAQQELFDAQVNLASAKRDKMLAIYGIHKNMGMLTATELGLVTNDGYIENLLSGKLRRATGF